MRHQRLISASVGVLSLAGLLIAPSGAEASSQSKASEARAVVSKLHDSPSARGQTHARVRALTQLKSINWSGCADGQPTTYKSVSAQWAEPTLKCTTEDRVVVFWVGIDGLTSGTVEQAGTLGQCFQGTAFYYTWWEMFPTNNITIVGSTVHALDAITASVNRSGTSYTLKVTDATRSGNSFTTTQSCTTCANSSAEIIAERPSNSFGIYPLAQFSTWKVTGAAVVSTTSSGTISSFADSELTMVDVTVTYNLAQPTSLSSGGAVFSDNWKNSY